MRTSDPCKRLLGFAITAMVTLLSALPARAQSSSAEEMTIQPTAADGSAALAAQTRYRHAYPAHTAAAQALSALQTGERIGALSTAGGRSGGAALLQYFTDVQNEGGHVVKSAVSHAIYLQPQSGVQCTVATCWGDPEGFLRDLGNSEFIHVIDQYVGTSTNNRYKVGFHATVNYTPPATALLDTDIQAFVHAVAAKTGAAGYGHIYHVFLPPGQDECSDSTLSDCYSPDNLAAFDFCAYHSSVDFADIGHVLYTVQPYQNIPDCEVQPGSVNGSLVDSANDVLNHETFETISDPDGDAWINTESAPFRGLEIADECVFFGFDASGNYNGFKVPTFLIGRRYYAVQLVNSNEQHACSSAPSGLYTQIKFGSTHDVSF
jgi:hypothetical protein